MKQRPKRTDAEETHARRDTGGFASTEEGNILDEGEQWAKLRMIVALARDVWGNS